MRTCNVCRICTRTRIAFRETEAEAMALKLELEAQGETVRVYAPWRRGEG